MNRVRVRPGFEVSATAVPATRDEALMLAQAWGYMLSHWNEIKTQSAGAEAWALCNQADAAQVQRLAALWAMLPQEVEVAVELGAAAEESIQTGNQEQALELLREVRDESRARSRITGEWTKITPGLMLRVHDFVGDNDHDQAQVHEELDP